MSITQDIQSHDLERIERHATHARNCAINITGAVRLLRGRPAFDTKADDMLRLSENELETALSAVRKAMAELSSKPVTA
jgi:hypothetical protein